MKKINGLFDLQFIKVSHKWANKKIKCNIMGIKQGCGGNCCKGNFYPASSNNGVCYYLSSKGCVLMPNEKPIKCLLYPFTIKNNTLVLYGRALVHSCKLNYFPNLPGKTILEEISGNLIELFGQKAYNKIYEDCIIMQKDSYIKLPQNFINQTQMEVKLEKLNKIPIKRNESTGI